MPWPAESFLGRHRHCGRLRQLLTPQQGPETRPLSGLSEQPGRQEHKQQDHDDRVDHAAVLLDAGEPVDDPGHEDGPTTAPQTLTRR